MNRSLLVFAVIAMAVHRCPAQHQPLDTWQDSATSPYVESTTDKKDVLAYTHRPATTVAVIAKQLVAGEAIGKGWVVIDMADAFKTVKNVPGGCGNADIYENADAATTWTPFRRVAEYIKKLGGDFAIVRGARGADVLDQFDWNLEQDFKNANVRLLAYHRLTFVGPGNAKDPLNPTKLELEEHGKAQAAATIDIARRASAVMIMPTDLLYVDGEVGDKRGRGVTLLTAYMNAINISPFKPQLIFSEVNFDNAKDNNEATTGPVLTDAKNHKLVGDYLRDKCPILSPRGFWKSRQDLHENRAAGMAYDFFDKHHGKTANKDYIWMMQTANGIHGGYSYIGNAVEEYNKESYNKDKVTGVSVWALDYATCNDLQVFYNSTFPRPSRAKTVGGAGPSEKK